MISIRTAWRVTLLCLAPALCSTAHAAATERSQPMALKWPDRRPIGQLFLSQAANVTKANPDGYLARDVDTQSPAGKKAFRKRLLDSADKWIRVMKDTGGQGMIVWDLEGYQQPSMVYVGDPRVLPKYAPAMDEVADAFFKRFLDAGLRTGLTIRPNGIFLIPPASVAKWGKWGYLLYRDDKDDVVKELSERIAYAKKRWGCTLFYMDTNGYYQVVDGKKRHVRLPTSMMKRLHELHPDVLIIPEHPVAGYHAYVAQYREVRGGWTGTPAAERAKHPGAFSVLQVAGMAPGAMENHWGALAGSVMRGDVLFFFGWWPSDLNESVRRLYQQAQYLKRKAPGTTDMNALAALLADKDPAVRFGAARVIGGADDKIATELLLRVLAADKDWVVRKEAIAALGRRRAAGAVGPLMKVVEADRGSLRFLTLLALAKIGRPAVAPLTKLASSPHRDRRYAAAYGLGLIDDANATAPLLKLLADKRDEVRKEAVVGLGRRKTRAAAGPLLKLLAATKNWTMQVAVLTALGEIGDPAAVEAVRKFLTVEAKPGWVQQRLRSAAARALAKLKRR